MDIREIEKEKWTDLKGYDETVITLDKTYSTPMYRISSFGRIMSNYGQGCREITIQVNNHGQKMVMLTDRDGGKVTTELVGLLVASHFVPNPNGYTHIKYKDGDPGNCRADNIEWVSLTDKQREQYKKYQKKVNRYALDGTYLDSFESIKDAAAFLGEVNPVASLGYYLSAVSSACKSHKKFNNFQWRYDKECPAGKRVKEYREDIKVYYQIDKKTYSVLAKFTEMKDIADFLGKDIKSVQANINNCCHGRRPTAYGYIWAFETKEASYKEAD